MKEEIIGNKENNTIKKSIMKTIDDNLYSRNICSMDISSSNYMSNYNSMGMGMIPMMSGCMNNMNINNNNFMSMGMNPMMSGMNNMNINNNNFMSMSMNSNNNMNQMGMINQMNNMNQMMNFNQMQFQNMNFINSSKFPAELQSEQNESSSNNIKKGEKKKKLNINIKDDIMKIINTQDFVNGFWIVNEYTENIKEKYQKEYEILIKNIADEKVVITILMVYFINKEHPELLDELLMILKKAKIFIKKETKDSYENIIKQI